MKSVVRSGRNSSYHFQNDFRLWRAADPIRRDLQRLKEEFDFLKLAMSGDRFEFGPLFVVQLEGVRVGCADFNQDRGVKEFDK